MALDLYRVLASRSEQCHYAVPQQFLERDGLEHAYPASRNVGQRNISSPLDVAVLDSPGKGLITRVTVNLDN